MPAPTSISEFLELVRKSGVLDDKRLEAHVDKLREAGELPAQPAQLTAVLVRDGFLTNFQAEQLAQGKWRRFTIGKYRVLERLGSGGMGTVFLCEHKFMRRRVAVKVLPTAKAADESSLLRFYREAKAIAALDHPNIVHAYDIDRDENLHFIVMEFVDGPSFQEIVRRSGPLSVERACHYISQAAQGLDHANLASIVHRDIKPGNILVDRAGVVKILDMGLARFFNDEEDMLTRKYDENVLGTADYLAPEQADDSHEVDIRADIYSLGGTFYFLLTGKTPFGEGSVPQKLMWQRTRQPKPVSSFRNDVPAGVLAVLDKMMAKEPEQRYRLPSEICAALATWTQTPIPPPAESELPQLSPAAMGGNSSASLAPVPGASSPGSEVGKKTWHVTGATSAAKSSTTAGPPGPTTPTGKSGSAIAPATKALPAPRAPRPPGRPSTAIHAPTPTKSPPMAQPTAAEEEHSAWATVGPDTAEAAARGDTPPLVPGKSRISRQSAAPPTKIDNKKLMLLALAGGALVFLGVLGIVALSMILRFLSKP